MSDKDTSDEKATKSTAENKKDETTTRATCTYKGEKYSHGAEVVMNGQRKYCDSVGDWVDM